MNEIVDDFNIDYDQAALLVDNRTKIMRPNDKKD